MIVVDSSALCAILLDEADALAFREAITSAESCAISAVNIYETALVIRMRCGSALVQEFWNFVSDYKVLVYPFSAIQVRAAFNAFERDHGVVAFDDGAGVFVDVSGLPLAKLFDALIDIFFADFRGGIRDFDAVVFGEFKLGKHLKLQSVTRMTAYMACYSAFFFFYVSPYQRLIVALYRMLEKLFAQMDQGIVGLFAQAKHTTFNSPGPI